MPRNTEHEHSSSLEHLALFYHGSEQFTQSVRTFVEDGLTAGESTLVAVPTGNLEALRAALGGAADRIRFEDMTGVGRNPSRILALIEDWRDRHPGRARFVGEPAWSDRSDAELVESARHEALINIALGSSRMTVLCPYDADHLPDETLNCAERTHPLIASPGGGRCPSARYSDQDALFDAGEWPLQPPRGRVAQLSFTDDLHALRKFVHSARPAEGLAPDRRADLAFALSEAAANVIKHGRSRGTVKLWRDRSAVVGEVTGPGSTIERTAGRRRPAPDARSGRGLWLINQVCDLVQLRATTASTTVRVHVNAQLAC